MQDESEAGGAVSIVASIAGRISFATHQCDVPLLVDLVVRNEGNQDLERLGLSLETSPAVVAPRVWPIDRLNAGTELHIKDRRVALEGGILASLTERMRAEAHLTIRQRESVLASATYPLIALARNEWGGAAYTPELLAAFVMPNDLAVQHLLKEAAGVLERSGDVSAIDGYQSKSRKRSWAIVSAIWTAMAAKRLTYAQPPASFESQGQKVRFPTEIEQQGLATCLDTALFFASAIEQAGLHPVIAFTKGHAFCGAWLQPQYLPTLTTDDSMELRKAVGSKELVLFETTLVTGSHPAAFSKAVQEASRQIAEDRESEFVFAIDIKQARSHQIRPLATTTSGSVDGHTAKNLGLDTAATIEAVPELPAFDLGVGGEDKPTTPEGRVEQWKRKLLDLTKRNRLLNLRPSKSAISIFCPDLIRLEDKLAANEKITLIPPLRRANAEGVPDAELYTLRTGDALAERYAAEALDRNEIVANVSEKDLEAGLLELYRKAKTDLQEGGSNTLFLALGMLKWKPAGDETRSFRAPLVLIPLKMERSSAKSKIRLQHHEDDPVFNLTLKEMLQQEFGVLLPELAGELPKDESGVDFARVREIMRRKVRDIPGFEVTDEIVLSTFSFAKYLMWKDLADRTELLKQSDFVRHLIESPREPYRNSSDFLHPHEVDDRIDPSELFMPLNSDSSQVVAVHASAGGGDFVLEGPPGTGKSETIGNIIAHNLAHGRRVLFVSEKMAALDVVHRRLRERGLGDFCLELHSSKANKREVLGQLGAAWDQRQQKTTDEWRLQTEKLKVSRDQLNQLVRTLHRPGATGISPRQAIGRSVRYGDVHRLRLEWGDDLDRDDRAKTIEGLVALEALSKDLGQQFGELSADDFSAFAEIGQEAWSFAWQAKVASCSKALTQSVDDVRSKANSLCEHLGLSLRVDDAEGLESLAKLAASMADAARFDLGFSLAADGTETFEALEALSRLTLRYRELLPKLSAAYPEQPISSAPIEDWEAAWSAAQGTVWPLSWFRRRRCAASIKAHFSFAHTVRTDVDIAVLKDLRGICREMEAISRTLPAGVPWNGVQTDIDRCRDVVAAGRKLRESMLRLVRNGAGLVEIRQALRRTYVDGRELLQAGMPIAESGRSLQGAVDQFRSIIDSFSKDLSIDKVSVIGLTKLSSIAQAVLDRQGRLNAWCRWVEVKRKAEAQGLTSVVRALEAGSLTSDQVAQEFRTAYCVWAAPHLIDERPELRTFSAVKHEDLIHTFRQLDKRLSDLSADYIRATLSQGIPAKTDKVRLPGYGVLSRELIKKTQHKPVRQLIGEMGDALSSLTPCLMMSPLSIAQFLPVDSKPFDLVVFDEASQITVWDAIGSVARAKNVVVVGDPKQMPPTSFFDKSAGGEDSEADDVADLESILDEALSASVKHHRLTGHYRSRHESLIAFSNYSYYDNQLVTYPAPETKPSAVYLKKVGGLYGKGKERTNPIEAKAVVGEAIARLRDPITSTLSLGIVTLNAEQQRLIEDLLDQERRADPELERFFGDATPEPVFVKNLETVQGDQRDVILFSIGYGPTVPGAQTMSMNFGPLNRKGGERRLNVAITRATTEVVVFASFDSAMIDLTRTSARAVHDLKQYLDFAERGPIALGEAVRSVGGDDAYDSDFEFTVAEGLRKRGWTVHTQIGVSKFRIDLGVVHPDKPGAYLAGVECDGATYHSLPSARDRDRVRHVILERLGWQLLRVWSTDFFIDPRRVLDVLDTKLKSLLEVDRTKAKAAATEQGQEADKPELLGSGFASNADAEMGEGQDTDLIDSPGGSAAPEIESLSSPAISAVSPALPPDLARRLDAARFYDDDYAEVIAELANFYVDELGPVTFKHVSERIARLHGFKRTGSEIKSRIWSEIRKSRQNSRDPDGHTTFWPKGFVPQVVFNFRGMTVNGSERSWADIPYSEKLGLAVEALGAGISKDPIATMTERLGRGRIVAAVRDQFAALLSEAAKRSGGA